MNQRTIKLLGPSGELLATGQAAPEGDHFAGSIDLTPMPASMLQIFQEFEELVNGQVFSLLDDVEQRINDLGIKVVFDDGREAFIEDLQIYPDTRLISFDIRAGNHASFNGEHPDRQHERTISQTEPRPRERGTASAP